MAIFHANVKAFSRGKNHSAVAAAAYRAGVDLVDTSARVIHRYSRRKGVISHRKLPRQEDISKVEHLAG